MLAVAKTTIEYQENDRNKTNSIFRNRKSN